ncbi:MAG: stage II sporulation protein R [Acutalibacter sp.]|nr:stage II sporulation protein R [Acutalibacter sp.]
MSIFTKKTALRVLAAGFLLTVLAGWFRVAASSQRLPESVLRLHVVANSDSPQDQALKLKVRDAVLAEADRWCAGAETLEEANFQVCTHLEAITAAARRRVEAEGSSQRVNAQVTELAFPEKDYQGFTLPAGRYRALRVTLGEGEGQNWWCVVFPALCLPAASGDPLAQLPQDQREVAENPEGYRVELKLVEWYEALREWVSGAK